MSQPPRYLSFELLTPLGKPVFFGDLLRGTPTIACFLRHFGCLFCFEHAADALAAHTEIKKRGAQLLLVGNGNPEDARRFARDVGLTGSVYTDPSRRLYRELSMRHGMLRVVNFSAAQNARRAFNAGFQQVGVLGDRWQLGGNVVFGREGEVRLVQRAEVAGDLTQVVRALDALP